MRGVAYLAPNWFTRKVFNPLAMRLGFFGTETLTVARRRSGEAMSVPVVSVDHEDKRYLVSTRGESDWVKNLRAAGGGTLSRRGHHVRFAADELPLEARPPVIAAYRAKLGRQVEGYWRALPDPGDHPVFLIDAQV
jgi:deazaflavin-dependent oxidoreductase (nitroreductase family)